MSQRDCNGTLPSTTAATVRKLNSTRDEALNRQVKFCVRPDIRMQAGCEHGGSRSLSLLARGEKIEEAITCSDVQAADHTPDERIQHWHTQIGTAAATHRCELQRATTD